MPSQAVVPVDEQKTSKAAMRLSIHSKFGIRESVARLQGRRFMELAHNAFKVTRELEEALIARQVVLGFSL
jgi:hypothetical protein